MIRTGENAGISIEPSRVHETIGRHQCHAGFKIVPDLERSHGSWMHDAVTGADFLDAYTSFASWPIGFNHPAMADPDFRRELTAAALTKISNADLYTVMMARFVEAFATRVTPEGFPHHFWISGGALAVENALKTAFDWKARKLGRTSFTDDVNDLVVVHFRHAFHGRSGYTMSLTNTGPAKIGLFPKFAWPRIHSPAIEFDLDGGIANDIEAEERHARTQLDEAFTKHKGKVAAIIIEPMQGEGGDRHFRPDFLQLLRDYADREEAILIFDEVQTGFFGTGKPWHWQNLGVAPDVVAFGKKAQVCGIYASTRIDEVPGNVFTRGDRLNSTWGSDLADMVRSRRIIEIIEREGLADNAVTIGQRTLAGLREIARETGALANVRGIGTLVAFSLGDTDRREKVLKAMYDRKLLALRSGEDSIRFRLPLVMTDTDADELLERTSVAVHAVAQG